MSKDASAAQKVVETSGDEQIRDVWASNLEEEMESVRKVVEEYPYISMDTEFPGVIVRPIGNFKNQQDFRYQTLRCNVDLLNIIQIGLSFSNEAGEVPPGVSTWQFNFKFNLETYTYSQESIDLLSKSGIDFGKNESQGVDVRHFAELLMSSGCVLMHDVKWISFHSSFDFAYLLKILTCNQLPREKAGFFRLLDIYFPCIYDVKFLINSCKSLKGGLQEVSDTLQIERIGIQHQAGSDSLLTGKLFFTLKETFFDGKIDDSKFLGVLYGLSSCEVSDYEPPKLPPNVKSSDISLPFFPCENPPLSTS